MADDSIHGDIIRRDGREVAARLGRLLDPLGGTRLVLAGAGGALGTCLRAAVAAYNRAHPGRPAAVTAVERLPAAGMSGAEWVVNLIPSLRAVWGMLELARDGGARGLLTVAPADRGGGGRPAAETLCATHFRLYRTPVTVVRPFGIYGPGQRAGDGAIAGLVNAVLAGAVLTLPWDGGASASFCYAADVAEACLTLLMMPEAHGQVFDLGSPEQVTPDGLARAVAAVAGVPLPLVLDRTGRYGPRRRPDLARLVRLTGFRPRIGLEEGLRRTFAASRRERSSGAVNRA